ncbi:S1C family serine protease [Planctomicrobium sp.]|jgi:serine protease Do|nr:trypsin-like peptidase domain-containing protein [Planctomicrobium sp.]MBT5019201.1 PDZ domain-containing protein [Planctomicrobium sp.]MDA7527416.1 S1C family serine protease [bacterium]MDB4743417.1 S1C family serine protease [Planctomicrobium sp.]
MRIKFLSVLFYLLILQLPVSAQDGNPQAVNVDSVPVGFTKPIPKSVNELREMQEHLTELIPKLMDCTVNLQISVPQGGGEVVVAQGSGVIVSPQGHILTAAHVSGRPGRKVKIITSDGKSYRGRSLGRNVVLDASLVLIESDRKDWPYCKMADELPEPGDWSIVVAHPGGFQKERGLVIRLGRVIISNSRMIQTDNELVGGDSGGPLFGPDGTVIGVNTRIGESTDLNFHVPIDAYTRDWDRLIKGEDFRTHSGAYLGVTGVVKEDSLGMEVTEVYPGDPADRAGLLKGDILLTFQSRKVVSMQQLKFLVGEEMPGKSVKLGILRDGNTIEITLRLGMRWD